MIDHTPMQYFKPHEPYFVGDPMPFYHDGVFHLYYLQDENHHQALGGLGGHQWAHASSTDLVHWEHHPLAIAISEDWEGSICTGSVFSHEGVYYGFHAVRKPDYTQHLCLAVSQDGIHFEKVLPRPLASPGAEYNPRDYRDPNVFQDPATGEFHMLVTASLINPALYQQGGCLLRLTSPDLQQWTVREPFLIPGTEPGSAAVPECPDYFNWNGWYYLLFSLYGMAQYRMSRHPMGPWTRPRVDTFDGAMAMVMKTAAYHENRRIGVAYLASRKGDLDSGERMYAGNAVFREIVQQDDGSLGTKFPPEMVPPSGDALDLNYTSLTPGATTTPGGTHLNAVQGMEAYMLSPVPRNAHITLRIVPGSNTHEFGLCLRGSGNMQSGYYLRFLPLEQRVCLNQLSISGVDVLDKSFQLEVIMKDDIIDVCVDNRRCLVDRCSELKGDRLFFYVLDGEVHFTDIEVRPIESNLAL